MRSNGVRDGRSVVVSLVAALSIALAGSLSIARPAAAECMSPLPPQSVSGYLGYGFEAVVRTVSDQASTQLPDASPYDWEVTLDVTRVYRGAVPDAFVLDGWSFEVTCDNFHGEFLHPGDRLLVTTDGLRPHDFGGNVLVWRHDPTGWRFDNRVVHSHDAANRFIPHAARAATTRAAILTLMMGSLPATSTAGAVPAGVPDPATMLFSLLAAAATAAAFTRRRRAVDASLKREATAG